jgi:lipopolysaccharide transport system permease protein
MVPVTLESQTLPRTAAPSSAEIAPIAAPASELVTRLTPPTPWPAVNFSEIWKYRELLFFLVWRDVKVRYKQTLLGAAWAILQPAMMMVVFTVFFNRLAGIDTGGLPAPLFNLSGLLPWFFFQHCVNAASGSVIGSEHLITKIYFPRLIIPSSAVLAAAFDSLIAFSLLAVLVLAYGEMPSTNIVLLPIIYMIIGMLGLGLGAFIAALNVTYRDVRYIVPFLLQMGLFATPTIYMIPKGHEGRTIGVLMEINPLTELINGYRTAIFGGPMPWLEIGIATIVAALVATFGCLYFRKTEDRFADII